MPNWCENNCDFNLSLNELLNIGLLIDVTDKTSKYYTEGSYDLIFNLHLIFPNYFVDEYVEYSEQSNSQDKNKSEKDFSINNTFDNKWNYNWYIENIGCKWSVSIDTFCADPYEKNFGCFFQSPWSPPTGMFKAISKLGIGFTNEYEECGIGFQGVMDNVPGQGFQDIEETYVPLCHSCDKKVEGTQYCDELGEDICPDCLIEAGSTCCGAIVDNGVCSDCKEHNEGYQYEE